MLIEFSVSNSRSFYQKATFSMVAEKTDGKKNGSPSIFTHPAHPDIPLLRTAVLFGANASGKSNFLNAIDDFRFLILHSSGMGLGDKLPQVPFMFAHDSRNEPTAFEIEFIAQNGVRYIYGFSYTWNEIVSEYLFAFYKSNRKTDLFIREKDQKIRFGSSLKGEKKALENSLATNHLLLSRGANSRFDQLIPVYEYFRDNYKHVGSRFVSNEYSTARGFADPQFLRMMEALLMAADTGINGLAISETKEDANPAELGTDFHSTKAGQRKSKLEVGIVHKVLGGEDQDDDLSWPLQYESMGTKRLFALSGPILETLASGTVLPIDELNNHLHPNLEEMVVQMFSDPHTNPKNAQLIFTTHNVALLKKENFRRDQIWFVEKEQEGNSHLYSLSSFDKKTVRPDIPFDKWYTSGRFGAVPAFGDFQSILR